MTPGKDDNAVWRNKTRKAFDDLMEDLYKVDSL